MSKVQTNLPATGRVGIEPPAGAVVETSQPLQPEAIMEMQAKARANEKELAPLNFSNTPAAPPTEPGVKEATHGVEAPAPVVAAAVPTGYKQATARSEFPAGSSSESPSRGVPGTAPIPAGRKYKPLNVEGGFGEPQGEYYPFDGTELYKMVEFLAAQLVDRCADDLRFTRAVVYDRLSVTLQLVVEGEVEDQKQVIQQVLPPGNADKTSLEVAQAHGDSVVFVVRERRREFGETMQPDGSFEVETPVDAMRDELGIPRPGKRSTNGMLADVTW